MNLERECVAEELARYDVAAERIEVGGVSYQPVLQAAETWKTAARGSSCASARTSRCTTCSDASSSGLARRPCRRDPQELVHAEPGAMVFRYVAGRTLTPADVRDPAMLARIVPLVRTCHRELSRHFRGPAPIFWVLQFLRDYAARLAMRPSARPRAAALRWRWRSAWRRRPGRSRSCSATTTCSPPI